MQASDYNWEMRAEKQWRESNAGEKYDEILQYKAHKHSRSQFCSSRPRSQHWSLQCRHPTINRKNYVVGQSGCEAAQQTRQTGRQLINHEYVLGYGGE